MKNISKTIAELYDKDQMPEDLLIAHKENDLILERAYIGKSFDNDSERIEYLFDLYEKSLRMDLND